MFFIIIPTQEDNQEIGFLPPSFSVVFIYLHLLPFLFHSPALIFPVSSSALPISPSALPVSSTFIFCPSCFIPSSSSTFIFCPSWFSPDFLFHSPALIFRRLHLPSSSALHFPASNPAFTCPRPLMPSFHHLLSTTFFLVASTSRCPTSSHHPFSFPIFCAHRPYQEWFFWRHRPPRIGGRNCERREGEIH